MGERYYAPALGRWITPDLFLGEAPVRMVDRILEGNLYGYARNNPVTWRDPTGTEATGDTAAAEAAPTKTEDLPFISAGSIPRAQRTLADDADLVHVSPKGEVISASQAEKLYGKGSVQLDKMRMRPEAAAAFQRMREWAQKDGIDVDNVFLIYSAYRGDKRQAALNKATPGSTAKPGGSEHRTGFGADIVVNDAYSAAENNSFKLRDDLAKSDAYKWLEANAPRFGFEVLQVKRDASGNVTKRGAKWEPWHISYNPRPGTSLPPPPPAAPSGAGSGGRAGGSSP
jgi:LAS superfamily LD-carboxypeptidase LdcB